MKEVNSAPEQSHTSPVLSLATRQVRRARERQVTKALRRLNKLADHPQRIDTSKDTLSNNKARTRARAYFAPVRAALPHMSEEDMALVLMRTRAIGFRDPDVVLK